jgi:hypothetical protein
MSGDKRTVATDALETLGTILDGTQHRDAIHIAVDPVEAGADLPRGSHITVKNGIAMPATEGSEDDLGIVDPFLPVKKVKKGQQFWFLMHPRMVKSLRHVWSHPAFPDEAGVLHKKTDADIAASELWLRKFCDEADCPGYDIVMKLISEGSLSSPDSEYYDTGGTYDDEYLHFSGSDAHGSIPPEFWDHAELVLGRKLTQRPTYFSCSC